MKHRRNIIAPILLFLSDLLCIAIIASIAIYIRHHLPQFPYPITPSFWQIYLIFVSCIYLTLFPALIVNGAYRIPTQWRSSQAQAVILKSIGIALPASIVILFTLRFGIPRKMPVPTPSRLITVSIWYGTFISLTGTRLAADWVQQQLYNSGIGVQRSIIFGDGVQATHLQHHIEHHIWLGENVIGCVGYSKMPHALGLPDDLLALIQQHSITVIWLAPPENPAPDWLPQLLFAPESKHIIWRALPTDWIGLIEIILPQLSFEQRELFHARVQHHLNLSTYRVAMLGSRGVPANYSGIEKYIEEVGSYLAKQNTHVTVYCHTKYVSRRSHHRGMKLCFMPTIPTKHLETIIHTALATLHAILDGADIFHYHALGPTTLAWLPRLFGRKVITTVQGLDWQREKWGRIARWYLKIGEWATCHFPHITIVVSHTLARHYAEKHKKRTVYIPNGFEAPELKPADLIKKWGLNKNSYILFVGRLSPEKGCHMLIRSFLQAQTDKHLVLAGRATYDDNYYQQLLTEARNSARIHFTGFVQGQYLQELYTNAYFVVLPSALEGLSISLLEALSYGNCVLVSDVSENLEAIGDAGYSFPSGNSEALTQKIQCLFDNPDQVATARKLTQTRTANLMKWQAVADQTHALYLQMLKENRANKVIDLTFRCASKQQKHNLPPCQERQGTPEDDVRPVGNSGGQRTAPEQQNE